jgi:5-methylcytosine-specific restriction endonuclease McrA
MKEQILQLREEGKSYKEIMEIVGCSKGTISYHCGEGQKNKTNLRTKKYRDNHKTDIHQIFNKKVRAFLGSKLRDFNRNGNISLKYKDLLSKFSDIPKCYLTGRNIDLYDSNSYNLDHIIPKAKGGLNTVENLGLTCRDANSSKTDLLVDEYLNLCKEVLENFGYVVTKAKVP